MPDTQSTEGTLPKLPARAWAQYEARRVSRSGGFAEVYEVWG